MARLIDSPMGSGPQGPFESMVVGTLLHDLPDTYRVLPNFSIKQQGRPALEYDVVVLAPHAIYVLEAKEWYGRLTGDDTEWLVNRLPKKCPLWLVDLKCKVLKGYLGALAQYAWVDPVLVVPAGTKKELGGSWAGHVVNLDGLVSHLIDPSRVRHPGAITNYHDAIQGFLQGAWAERRRDTKRRYGGWEAVELLHADEEGNEYRAKRVLVDDPTPYRIRTWRVSPYSTSEEREKVLRIIRRPTEALAKIGRHPHLLPILAFDENADDNEFYEVTEWSEFGTLHGFLKNTDREPLTLRERLEITAGVASALEAVHTQGLVHRNVCPETILVGFDHQPYLTDFDRAYIEGGGTVFERTKSRIRNPAYIPPELSNEGNYEFDTSADMYSFGVLLYELLLERPPFDNPSAAMGAHGRPQELPSQVRDGVDIQIDSLIARLLITDNYRERPSASEALKTLHTVLGSSNGVVPAPPVNSQGEVAPPSFEIGSIVDGYFRIEQELGSGTFSRVYKVYHLDHGRYYTMKLLKNVGEVEVLLREYNEIGRNLPTHPNIAQMVWMSRLAPPLMTPYILNEYVEGETLEAYCDGQKSLSWREIKRIGLQLLKALNAFHPRIREFEQYRELNERRTLSEEEFEEYQRLKEEVENGILHRDIKPANILLELPSYRPKLIDFNIASKLAGAAGRGGTPRYWAPDRGQPDWRPDMDLFSLGIVLYELVAHQHPFPNSNPESGAPLDPRLIVAGERISDELAAFLLKSIQPSGPDRFQDAKSMSEALEAVNTMYAPPAPAPERAEDFPGITLEPFEVGKPNYNPYVTRLLTLYSQARKNNGGTRGLDEIARFTYVQTKLDLRLAPAIADGRFRLVIVTGNAGDGKTAFLQQVESYFKNMGVEVAPLPTGNGARWEHAGLEFRTNYDGSQDEGDVRNDDVLASFLEPFSGATFSEFRAGQVRLIAINEGRLLDFLEHSLHSANFAALRRFAFTALESGDSTDGLLLVNLNLRAIAAGEGESLVERQFKAMLKPEIWAPCEGCDYKLQCPIKHNADTFRDINSGQTVRARVRRLFEVAHLRRRAHATIRDLRSTLSWLLLRDHGCDDIAALLSSREPSAALRVAWLYYPEAFASEDGNGKDHVDDRLVALLRQADAGLTNEPLLDRRLDHDPDSAVPWISFDSRSAYGSEVLKALWRNTPRTQETVSFGVLLGSRRALIRRLRRWSFYERRDEGWQQMLPYRSWRLLSEVIYGATKEQQRAASLRLRDRVVEAISLSEGLRSTQVRKDFLALRASRVKQPSIRSYRLFPASAFSVQLAEAKSLGEFLEFAADSIDLVADASIGHARLRISLDLLEMLELIRNGYRPSPADLQGLFVNLLIFRNALLNLPFERVMVTADDEELYEITSSIDAGGGIGLKFDRYDASAGGVTEVSA